MTKLDLEWTNTETIAPQPKKRGRKKMDESKHLFNFINFSYPNSG